MTEHYLLQLFNDARAPSLDLFFISVTWLGSVFVLGPLSGVIGCLIRRSGAGFLQAVYVPFALGVTAVAVGVLKHLVSRSRPDLFEPVVSLPLDAAMPSGHAAQAMAFAVAVIFIVPRQRRIYVCLGLLPAVILVGLSRLYLQAHWPSDVLAGYLTGIVVASVSAYLLCVLEGVTK